MIGVLLAVAGLAAWSITATLVVVARDGYRAEPTDWTRLPDGR